MPLSHKHQRFAEEYSVDLNGAAAYRRAGYTAKNDKVASAGAARLLAKGSIKAEIDRLVAQRSAQTGLTAQDIWQQWMAICRADIGDVLDFTGETPKLKPAHLIPEHARRAIASMKVKRYVEGSGDNARDVEVTEFTFWNKPATLATVAKAMGELIEKILHMHTGPGGGPIAHEHAFNPPDVTADEFRALPAEERLRRLREAVHAINRN